MFKLRNQSRDDAHCRILGAPPWLRVGLSEFACVPGQRRQVGLRLIESALPAGMADTSCLLQVEVDGLPHAEQVQVTVRSAAG